jgi:hypothetical protein
VPCPCTSARQKLAPKAARAKYRDIFKKGEDIFKPIANRKCQQSSSLGILVPLSSKVNPVLLLVFGEFKGRMVSMCSKPQGINAWLSTCPGHFRPENIQGLSPVFMLPVGIPERKPQTNQTEIWVQSVNLHLG